MKKLLILTSFLLAVIALFFYLHDWIDVPLSAQASNQTQPDEIQNKLSLPPNFSDEIRSSRTGAIEPLPPIHDLLEGIYKYPLPEFDFTSQPYINSNVDLNFDYTHALASMLEEKILIGDSIAATTLAFRIKSQLLEKIEIDPSFKDGDEAHQMIKSLRRLFIVAAKTGSHEAAKELSNLYAMPMPWHDNVESITWLRASYAAGAFGWTDCLKDSTKCTVKEFNSLNDPDRFYSCVKSAEWSPCTPDQFEQAAQRLDEYIKTYNFPETNIVKNK